MKPTRTSFLINEQWRRPNEYFNGIWGLPWWGIGLWQHHAYLPGRVCFYCRGIDFWENINMYHCAEAVQFSPTVLSSDILIFMIRWLSLNLCYISFFRPDVEQFTDGDDLGYVKVTHIKGGQFYTLPGYSIEGCFQQRVKYQAMTIPPWEVSGIWFVLHERQLSLSSRWPFPQRVCVNLYLNLSVANHG